jgi:hypothetical protein
MRNPALMIERLEESGRKPDGGIPVVPDSGMSETEHERAGHFEHPCDVDLAPGNLDATSCIANAVHASPEAINQVCPFRSPKSERLLHIKGTEPVQPAGRIIDLRNNAS